MPKKIRLRLDKLETDPVRWKIYHPTFVPEKPTFIEFELPSSMMHTERSNNKISVVLSLEGMMAICHEICDAMNKAEAEKEIGDVGKWQEERRKE